MPRRDCRDAESADKLSCSEPIAVETGAEARLEIHVNLRMQSSSMATPVLSAPRSRHAVRAVALTFFAVTFVSTVAAQAPTAPDRPATQPTDTMPAVLDLTVEQILSRAEQLRARRQYDEAQNTLDVALKRGDRTVEVLILAAQVAEDRDDAQTARGLYLEARRLAAGDFRANLGLGRINVRVKYWRQAVAYLEAAERVAPKEQTAELQALLAQGYRGLKQTDRALAAAEKAIAADSSNTDARATLVTLRLDRSDFERALADAALLIQLCERKVEDNPGDQAVLAKLGEAYDTRLNVLREYHNTLYDRDITGNLTDKVSAGQEKLVAGIMRQVVDCRLYQAQLKLILTYYEILPLAEKAVENDPSNVPNLTQLALLYRNTAQDQKAAEVLAKILDIDPQNREARNELESLRGGAATPTPAPTATPPATPASAPADQRAFPPDPQR